MRRLLSFTFLLFYITTVLFAQLSDGFYRIKNVGSERYMTIKDNGGRIDISAMSADLGAIELFKYFSNVVSDPSSIIYVNRVGDKTYRFEGQGANTYEIVGYDLILYKNTDGSYRAYQSSGFNTVYIADGEKGSSVEGSLTINDKGTNYRYWNFIPLTQNEDEYFGLTPDVTVGTDYYTSLYASFPFTTASSGMNVYYVKYVENNVAVYESVANNTVAGGTPIFVKMSSSQPSGNKLNIASNNASALVSNQLRGVYFMNESKGSHRNLTEYDPNTMRVLGLTSEGKIGFVKSDITYLPANKAYLVVPSGSADEIPLMTQAEYEEYKIANTKYKLTYKVDGNTLKTLELRAGTPITPEPYPTKEGYSFSGWNGLPSTMPAGDVTVSGSFAINQYKLTYMIEDNEYIEYKSYMLNYGEAITPEPAPVLEGYTFDAWSEIPSVMPANDVIVYGTFTINTYKATYIVDGVEYATEEWFYNERFFAIDIPTREGYNFVGWIGVPERMPANNIVLTGEFVINKDNKFNLIFMVDGQEYYRSQVSFGDIISFIDEPTKEGCIFSGWSEVPETMPLKDVVVTGKFFPKKYKLTYEVDGVEFATDSILYGEKIVLIDNPIKSGYIFSGWGDVPTSMPAHDLVLRGTFVVDSIDELISSRLVDVYTLQGVKIKSKVSMETIGRELPCGIYIVEGRKIVIK